MYVYLYAKQVISLWVATRCTISPLYLTALSQWAIEEREANFVVNSTAFAWRLARLAILGLCNERTWTDTCLAWHCKGVACETLRLEPRFHSVPGRRINTKSKKNIYSHFWMSETPSPNFTKMELISLTFCLVLLYYIAVKCVRWSI